MSNATVLWFGPVSLAQVEGASVVGVRPTMFQCTGDGSPSCGQIAESWTGGEGRRLPHALRSKGLDQRQVGDLVIGAFSAGGSAVKRLLLHEDDRAEVKAVLLADATYGVWASPGSPEPPEGFVLYCLDALRERKLFVATASSAPNKTLPNGAQTLEAIRREVEARSGRSFAATTLPDPIPQPARAWRLGNVILADYQAILAHPAHATRLAAPIWQNILLPWLDEAPEQDVASNLSCPATSGAEPAS